MQGVNRYLVICTGDPILTTVTTTSSTTTTTTKAVESTSHSTDDTSSTHAGQGDTGDTGRTTDLQKHIIQVVENNVSLAGYVF